MKDSTIQRKFVLGVTTLVAIAVLVTGLMTGIGFIGGGAILKSGKYSLYSGNPLLEYNWTNQRVIL